MLDTLLATILTVIQLTSGTADSYTTDLCFNESDRIGVTVYESNPLYTVPFGGQPSPVEFALSDVVSVAAMYGIGWLIRKTPAREWWFVPQVALIGVQCWQAGKNYTLYQRMRDYK